MTTTGQVIGAGTAFGWLGMVLGISFLETPLKFQAPGITLPLGLGIGRIMFRALNAAEIILAVVLFASLIAFGPPGVSGWILFGITGALLATQVGLLRPRLDRRAGQIINGHIPRPSRLHLAYITLEILKVAALIALGTLLITRA